MKVIRGYFFDGQSAQRWPGQLTFQGNQLQLNHNEQTLTCALSDATVSPRTGAPTRLISLSGDVQFQCADDPFLDTLPQQDPNDGLVAWLEQRWAVALACIGVIALLLFAGYRYGLPAAAERIAQRIPIESEQSLGSDVLDSMEAFQWILSSQLAEDHQTRLARRFDQFRQGMTYQDSLRLEFRNSPVFGANAFALPGGTIVVTDDLVEIAESDDEVLAVLAHEIGHIERRHIVRSLIQNSLVALAATAVTADAASLTAAVVGLPVVLVQSEYSREFEAEADTFAFNLLRDQGVSPAAFADIMERMQQQYPDSEEGPLSFLDSHPLIEGRIRRARAAALDLPDDSSDAN